MMRAAQVLDALLCRAPIEDRALIVAAHPDDETIGMGASLCLFGDALLLHVTDGAPRDGRDMREHGFGTLAEYAAARERELAAALAVGGAGRLRRAALGLSDGDAWRDLAQLARRLREAIEAERPAALFVQPYEGGHPDHDAAAFSAAAACRLLGERGPALVEMTAYHAADGSCASGDFVAAGGAVTTVRLTAEEIRRKRAMLDCFETQRLVLAGFGVEVERFRAAPDYDFTRPPHRGALHYEAWDWSITGEIWRRHARAALAELGLSRVA